MPFSEEDKVLINNLNLYKGYGPRRLMTEFPEKNWKKGGLEKLLRKLREKGSTNRRHGSGRPKHARTEENVTSVEELVQSQEDQPQTHRWTRQIGRERRISQSSVVRIIHRDLDLKRPKRRTPCSRTDWSELPFETYPLKTVTVYCDTIWTATLISSGSRMKRCSR